MAGANKVLISSFVVDAAVTRYSALIASTTDGHATPSTTLNTGTFVGIADADQNSGDVGPVVSVGVMPAIASGAISYGASVVVTANGQIAPASSVTGGTTPNVIGYALQTASEAGDIICIKLA